MELYNPQRVKETGKVQERSLKFILNDYDKVYFLLIDIFKKPSMEVKKLRILLTEIFKTLKLMNHDITNAG